MNRSIYGCSLTLLFLLPTGTFADEPKHETNTLLPQKILRPVPAYLQDNARHFQSAPSITVSRGGRLWVTWHTGGVGEGDDNCVLVISSGDGGRTWSKPLFALDAPGPLRFLDPGFWTDPNGKVWLFYGQLYSFWDGRCGLWAIHPENPDDENTAWSDPRRLCDGYLKNKPLVTSDGTWMLPVEFMSIKVTTRLAFPMPERNAANVFVSQDKGRTVRFFSQAQVPSKDRDCYENMIVQRKDSSLWMLVRTGYGMGESFSTDGGKTWTEVVPAKIHNPNSRFFLGRLNSGRLLLVKNGPVDKRIGRAQMTAFVSADDGQTWKGGLVLDERNGVSYPDAVQDRSGTIYIIHDRDRQGAKELLFHRITEADVLAGKLVSPGSDLKIIANKATGK